MIGYLLKEVKWNPPYFNLSITAIECYFGTKFWDKKSDGASNADPSEVIIYHQLPVGSIWILTKYQVDYLKFTRRRSLLQDYTVLPTYKIVTAILHTKTIIIQY